MDRRTFIGGLALGAHPLSADVARAQAARKVAKIGILGSAVSAADLAGADPRSPSMAALIGKLRELGYAYGRDFVTEVRSAEGRIERFPSFVAELIGLRVDVIVGGGPPLDALKQATSTIPVVMAAAADPVGQGFAESIARPGRNFTGFSLQLVETTAKRLELLKETARGDAPVAVLWDRKAGPAPLSWRAAASAAQQRGWKLLLFDVRDFGGEVEAAVDAAARERVGALLVVPTSLFDQQQETIAELAIRHRLPAMYAFRSYVDAGGLMSYGADLVDIWRRAAFFIDKILKGARAGDLPIEQPTKFDFVVNVKAAKAIGLALPRPILSRATELIQ